MTVDEFFERSFEEIFAKGGHAPEMIHVPGFGAAKLGSPEADAYLNSLLKRPADFSEVSVTGTFHFESPEPRVYTRVMDDGIKTKDGAA